MLPRLDENPPRRNTRQRKVQTTLEKHQAAGKTGMSRRSHVILSDTSIDPIRYIIFLRGNSYVTAVLVDLDLIMSVYSVPRPSEKKQPYSRKRAKAVGVVPVSLGRRKCIDAP
jgi:uncharacterized protein (DUF1786 family)